MEKEKIKRRLGDRKDGRLIRDIDPMHFICPLLYPNRCDNEAFISEVFDLENVEKYLAKKNENLDKDYYNVFQFIVTAMLKMIYVRPKMNRFIANKNIYERYEKTASFVIKKTFSDTGEEGLAFIHSKPEDNFDSIHSEIIRQVNEARENANKKDKSSEEMEIFNKMPRFISKFLVWIITRLDIKGKVPKSLIDTDPYYSSIVLSHLGSIRLHSGYHHLTNWGTNSIFVAIGEKKVRPFYDENGNVEMKESIDIGLTIDERIADGFYYSKCIHYLKKLFAEPELLDQPLQEHHNK